MEREARAVHLLAAYRERRRRRRAEDTWFGSSTCLLEHVEAQPGPAAAQRRLELIEEARREGMSAALAEQLYDVAREEGLDPGLAYELVRCGLGVCPPRDGMSNAPGQPTSDKYAPGWVLQPPADPDELLRERMLRLSFRRLRAQLEEHDDPSTALKAFAAEPDVGIYGY